MRKRMTITSISFDAIQLATVTLAVWALVTGSFTLLAVAVIVSTFNLKLTWKL